MLPNCYRVVWRQTHDQESLTVPWVHSAGLHSWPPTERRQRGHLTGTYEGTSKSGTYVTSSVVRNREEQKPSDKPVPD